MKASDQKPAKRKARKDTSLQSTKTTKTQGTRLELEAREYVLAAHSLRVDGVYVRWSLSHSAQPQERRKAWGSPGKLERDSPPGRAGVDRAGGRAGRSGALDLWSSGALELWTIRVVCGGAVC